MGRVLILFVFFGTWASAQIDVDLSRKEKEKTPQAEAATERRPELSHFGVGRVGRAEFQIEDP